VVLPPGHAEDLRQAPAGVGQEHASPLLEALGRLHERPAPGEVDELELRRLTTTSSSGERAARCAAASRSSSPLSERRRSSCEARSEALEPRMEHMIMRKHEQIDLLERVRRDP
jgi:hypothetical protein